MLLAAMAVVALGCGAALTIGIESWPSASQLAPLAEAPASASSLPGNDGSLAFVVPSPHPDPSHQHNLRGRTLPPSTQGAESARAGVLGIGVATGVAATAAAWASPVLFAAGVVGAIVGLVGKALPSYAYELMPLPYAYDALEPAIDSATLHFHHDNHHQTYVTNINKVLDGQLQPSLLELQRSAIERGPEVRLSAGGVYNHNFYWLGMAPTGAGGAPSTKLAAAIDQAFGSIDEFMARFEAAGTPVARPGSGWVWLVVHGDGKLAITSTPNQDNPLMDGVDGIRGIPILTCDVWEHAYYLKYQYRRPAYMKAWWDVVNWQQVSAWYDDALEGKAPIC